MFFVFGLIIGLVGGCLLTVWWYESLDETDRV